MNLNSEYITILSESAHYYRKYFTGPSEHCAVSLCQNGGHPTESDQECFIINLVTTLTENPPDNTDSSDRTHIASVLRVLLLLGVQCSLRCLNLSSNVQIT
jgi:hypothetical protein